MENNIIIFTNGLQNKSCLLLYNSVITCLPPKKDINETIPVIKLEYAVLVTINNGSNSLGTL